MKRLLALILVFVLLFSLISCNDEPPTPNDGDTANDGSATGDGATDGDENNSSSPTANPITDFEYSYSERYGGIGITKYVGTSKSIVFPEEIDGQPVKVIGGHLLDDGEMRPLIESVVIPDTVEMIAGMTFLDCTSLVSVEFGEGIHYIGEWAFRECTSLQKIILPPKLETIGAVAFYGCTSATELFIPKTLTVWEYSDTNGTFGGCTALHTITIEDGLEVLGGEYGSFVQATALKSLIIPASVKEIASSAFHACTNLESVTFLGDAPEVGWNVFGFPGEESQTVSQNLTIYYDSNTLGWDDSPLRQYHLVPMEKK